MSDRPDVLIALGHEFDRAAHRTLSHTRRSYGGVAVIAAGLLSALIVTLVVLVIPARLASPSRQVGGVRRGAGSGFAALRRSRGPADLLTAAAFEPLANLGSGEVFEADQSRLVFAHGSELAWLVPSPVRLCLVTQATYQGRAYVNGDCAPTRWALQHGLRTTFNDRILLVLPASVPSVEVIRPDKHVVRVTPDANGAVTTAGNNLIARTGTGRVIDRLLYPSPGIMGFTAAPTPPEQLIAQAHLTTPKPSSSGPSGEARIYRSSRLRLMSLDLRNVPPATGPTWYAVWLRTQHHPAVLWGFIPIGQTRGSEATISGAYSAYSIPARVPTTISVTAAHSRTHPTPGKTILTTTITPP